MIAKTKREKAVQERRQLIVEAAAECFAEKGFHQTSMRDLAKRAGISLGNVYNHFDSKTDLVLEIAKLEAEGMREIQAELSKIKDPVRALNEFVQFYAKACAERDYALLAAEITSEGLRNPEISADFVKNRSMLVSTVTAVIEQAAEHRGVTLEVSAEDGAEFAIDLIEGFAGRFAFAGEKPSRKELAKLKAGIGQLIGIQVSG